MRTLGLSERNGLDINIQDESLPIFLIENEDIKDRIIPRPVHAHKGMMGHALLVSGQYGMAGATILAAKACMRSGVGKLTIHTAGKNNDILQCCVPEAIISHDKSEWYITDSIRTAGFNAAAIGPGMGTHKETDGALLAILKDCKCPLVLDADALNILSTVPNGLSQIPKGCILTPHPKEFERLFGVSKTKGEQLTKALKIVRDNQIIIVLKGHNSMVCTPKGEAFINPTGNAGMATAGSGDVLTGVICGLLARGYTPHDAALIGVYLHGLAGDIAATKWGKESMIASDIVESIGEAFKTIENS